jgi:hypothetical protein
MTTKTEKFEITRTIIDSQEVRGTFVGKRKYYFLADLKSLYGSKFIAYLPTEPISRRIAVSGNSQMRDLVNVSEFKDGFRKYNKERDSKNKQKLESVRGTAPSIAKPEKTKGLKLGRTIAPQLEMLFESTEPKQPTVSVNVSLPCRPLEVANFHTEEKAVAEARWRSVRRDINKTISLYTEKKLPKASEETIKEAILRNYGLAYDEFDKVIAKDHCIPVEDLAKYGLGLGKRGKANAYINIIEKNGWIDWMQTATNNLFDKQK